MIHVGDKVRFLNDVGGGKVTSIINKKMVNVEDEDGFEIPTLITELVVIESSVKSYIEEKPEYNIQLIEPIKEEELASKIIEGKDSPEFYLAFVPQDQKNPVGGEIEAWLVNDSNFFLIFNYSHFEKDYYTNVKSGELGPNSQKLLDSFIPFDLTEFPVLFFQLIYFQEESKEMYQPIVKELKVSPVKFYKEKTFSSNSFFQKNAYLLSLSGNPMTIELDKLTDSDVEKVIIQKEKENSPVTKPVLRQRNNELVEVDLHINQLIDKFSDLTNHEILQIQMERFNSEMKDSINNRVKRIVFIHGVGKGALKAELHKELKIKYKKYYVQDASFKEYGYGATMVILRKG
ncbi:MAG: DUF2027 domain-containing protein [Mariniphaga sp.]|nr:DUF2027 domain-containing protein [Mariniphaga sp.]